MLLRAGGEALTRCFSCELSALSSLIGPRANLRHVSLSFRDDQTSLQSFNFSSYLCLSYGYDTAFSVEEAPQTEFACWLVFANKMHITQEMLTLDHIIKWVHWQKGGVGVGVAYSKKYITSKQFR